MKRKPAKGKAAPPKSHGSRRRYFLIAMAACGVAAAGVGARMVFHRGQTEDVYLPRPKGQLTFARDISPIVFQHCAVCHRPGQGAPFALLNYQDVKKHAQDIASVTARRFMPPWLPEGPRDQFVGDRRLTASQIGVIQQWVMEGAVEGLPSDLAPLPEWSGDWQLGRPDLVVTMPQPYQLPAEGRDVYRNFVIPTSVPGRRYVRAVEFHPGNPRVVHHAFIKVDRTAQSRRQDELDPEPGFGGMTSSAEIPGGHFLGWQPGRLAAALPDGLAWNLDPGNDLVLQLHMNSTGRPEQVQASVGLYFTDRPPTNTCFKMQLTSYAMEIPARATNYVVQDSYVLPVDARVLAVLPHAHYLGKEMQGWATLPDGSKKSLLQIQQWDFNWQGDYRYSQPVVLPKGSKLSMWFTYDNSTNNPRNPNHPPKPVTYGLQSSDEMAELWFQILTRNQADFDALAQDYETKTARLFLEHDEYLLRKDPNDPDAHEDLGFMLLGQNEWSEAERHFLKALHARPDFARAHYGLGLVLRRLNRLSEARLQFETALRLNPTDFKAEGNLGFVALAEGDPASARLHFENALRLNPDDPMARAGLADINKSMEQIRNGK